MARSFLAQRRNSLRDFNYSLDFGGLNSGTYVDFPSLFDPSSTDWSAAVFFRTNFYARDLNPWQSMAILSQNDGSGVGRSWLGINRTGMLLEDNFNGASNVTTFKVNNLGWFHALITFDLLTSTRKIYVNGVLNDTKVVTIEPSDGTLRLGSNKSGTRNITGNVAEFRVWDRKLSDSEALSYYFDNDFSSENLLIEALFSEGVDLTLGDSSGNANHGTIFGASWSQNVPGFKSRSMLSIERSVLLNQRAIAG